MILIYHLLSLDNNVYMFTIWKKFLTIHVGITRKIYEDHTAILESVDTYPGTHTDKIKFSNTKNLYKCIPVHSDFLYTLMIHCKLLGVV